MSPTPSKRKTTGNLDVLTVLAPLANKAAEALRDPETRQRVISQGRAAADVAQRWRGERAGRARAGDADDAGEESAFRVVHRRLGRREQRLREAITGLMSDDQVLAAQLAPVINALDGVVKALTVSPALPLMRRRQAHRAIDDVLDSIDGQLLDASLGLVPGAPDHDEEARDG